MGKYLDELVAKSQTGRKKWAELDNFNLYHLKLAMMLM